MINNTLAALLQELHSLSNKGLEFEKLCKWFLENDPSYSRMIKQVWLWKDWPENWGRDKGIDLIAEAHDGSIWAIQAKAYTEDYYITKDDVDRFLSESARKIIDFRLLIATTDRIGSNAKEVIKAQEKNVKLCTLRYLQTSNLTWPEKLSDLSVKSTIESKKPLPHQTKALIDIENGFKSSDRGQVYMACGTGKTLVGLWTWEQRNCKTALVLVPSISLVSQLFREWSENSKTKFLPLFVCSDATVAKGDDQIIANHFEFGFPVTTNAQDLVRALNACDTKKVIFSTYHSSPVIAQACQLDSSVIFDLIIADEAHRCAGSVASDFATVVSEQAIRAKHRLFMTATPKIFSERVKKKTNEFNYEIISMDDTIKFGPIFSKLSFSQAIKEKLLSDYEVIISVMDNKIYREYVEKGRFVSVDNHETDARTLASQLLIGKAIKSLDLKKIITFHNRKKAAKEFTEFLPQGLELLKESNEKPNISFREVIFGEMPQDKRLSLIKKFEELPEDSTGILANVRCLSEGVDVPELDAIAFIDPKGSEIDIVQSVGRVIRKPKKPQAKIGYIIIPIFIDEAVDESTSLDQSCFKAIWKVIRALRAHDDTLAEELDNIRLELGKREFKGAPKLPEKIKINLPINISIAFCESLRFKLVSNSTLKCYMPFEESRDYIQTLGLKSETDFRLYIAGKKPELLPIPDAIPRAPWVFYSNSGWKNWGDFLGTNIIAPRLRAYRSYEEAKSFASSLNLSRRDDWIKYAKGKFPELPLLPDDIPASPSKTYRRKEYGEAWAGWGDFLGTKRISNQDKAKKWRKYKTALKFVHKLKLKSNKEWRVYVRNGFLHLPSLPVDIPKKPDSIYKEWVNWPTWLGSDISKFNCHRNFLDFESARAFAHSLNLSGQKQWHDYCAGKFKHLPPKPLNIPSNPSKKYRNSGWKGYADWLGQK